jgi:aryl-alcohol dehydrogenase-like predicted oxidoreductase
MWAKTKEDNKEVILRWVVPSRTYQYFQLNVSRRVEKIAKARSVSMAQVAIAWSLSKDVVSAPIIGTTKLSNLYDLLGKEPFPYTTW